SNDEDAGRDRGFGSAAPEMVESREGAHRCSGDGAWCSCVGGRSRGRNTSEPAVSLAPAIAWGCAVCIVNIRGPNRRCADNRVADVAGSDRSGVYDWSAVADLRSCGCRDCGGGHAGSDRLWEGGRSRISGGLSMRVAMIGTGYGGLGSGDGIPDFGHEVTCVDKDGTKISALNSGEIPIYEPGLKDIVQSNVRQGRLQFTTALSEALKGANAAFIAVGTPSRRGDGHADLSYVYEAAREIAAALTDFTVIITKSTVPVGTGDEVERIIRELRPYIDVAVVSNPEFLREGAAIHDFKHPDRIVIGTDDERAKRVLAEIYRPLHLNQAPILYTGRRTAELIKYAANAFLATKITFINEI